METKKWYTSKVLWANALGIIAIVVQGVTGKEIISMEVQITVLAMINMILRFVTKEPVSW